MIMILYMEKMKTMPNLKLTKTIEFSIQELEEILTSHLEQEYNIVGETSFNFKVINKPYPCGAYHDLCDRHEFDGVKIVVTTT